MKLIILTILLTLGFSARGQSADLQARFAAPRGTQRVSCAAGSFASWLRTLPLHPAGTPVRLYNGRLKDRQDVHAAVATLSVGTENLQQCADAIMRLRAEYLRAHQQPISFLLASGRWLPYVDQPWDKYLRQVFAWANTESLQRQLRPVGSFAQVQPGDVLVVPGAPGHAVLVLDVAVGASGRRFALLGQSYMPAQQFHVLLNSEYPALGAWFELVPGQTLETPEYDFPTGTLYRF